ELNETLGRLARLPPLVTSWEIERLSQSLESVSQGEAFLLQAGDCTERLDDCETEAIVRNLKVLIQMSFVLIYGSFRRIVRVGRVAGQYAKPRSTDVETRSGVTLPVYRGDIINRSGFSATDRRPDPELMLRGYERAALTLNFIRSLIGGGFADLHHPENWELDFPTDSARTREYHAMVRSISQSLRFMEVVLGTSIRDSYGIEVFTSHEGLHLRFEQAQTRRVPRRPGWYNLGTHMPWIGYRTADVAGAHVEYFRGIANPVGLKIGPDMAVDHLLELIERLHAKARPGRLTIIHRMGAQRVQSSLPPLIEAVQRTGAPVVWSCDPMHGNTFVTSAGVKTRRFDDIVSELVSAFAVHKQLGSYVGGVHLEMTGDNVTECLGGSAPIDEPDLGRAYKSAVDPRLNYDQAMEIAFLIAEQMQK
ncbi:MAG TPA: 3-deoxy-7-phosphoheptulonate synthase class II, partial [Pirellulaceae bacterium]|nr:3-deoxy-7-phosphoheptulonate synthase class II [Pirellulaceae bacterium]